MTTLITLLAERSVPYPGGRFIGKVSIDTLSICLRQSPDKITRELNEMLDSGTLENIVIGGRTGRAVFYLVAA